MFAQVGDPEVLRLSAEDQELFAKNLEDPPPPNEAMRRAFEWRRKLGGDYAAS